MSLLQLSRDVLALVIAYADGDDPTTTARLASTCRIIRALVGDGVERSRRYDAALRRAIAMRARHGFIGGRGALIWMHDSAMLRVDSQWIAHQRDAALLYVAAYIELLQDRHRHVHIRHSRSPHWIDAHSHIASTPTAYHCEYAWLECDGYPQGCIGVRIESTFDDGVYGCGITVHHVWHFSITEWDARRLAAWLHECALEAYLFTTTPTYAQRLRVLTALCRHHAQSQE